MDNLIFVDVSSKDESLSAFSNLLPEGYEEGWNRVLIGCCNESGQTLGIVEFQESFEECEILWIYVDPTVRNQGIGHALINEVINVHLNPIGMKSIICQLNVKVLDDELDNEDFYDTAYTPLVRLFSEDERFDAVEIGQRYIISNASVKETNIAKKLIEKTSGKRAISEKLFDLPRHLIHSAYEIMEENHFIIADKKKFEESCVKDLCFCKTSGDSIVAIAICRWVDKKVIDISFVYAKDPNMLVTFAKDFTSVVLDQYPGYDYTVSVINKASRDIVSYIMGDIEPNERIIEYQWNYDLGLDFEELEAWMN